MAGAPPSALMSALGSKLGKLRTRPKDTSPASVAPGLGRRAGSSPQMSRAYSAMLWQARWGVGVRRHRATTTLVCNPAGQGRATYVRSVLNLPMPAVLRMERRVHSDGFL